MLTKRVRVVFTQGQPSTRTTQFSAWSLKHFTLGSSNFLLSGFITSGWVNWCQQQFSHARPEKSLRLFVVKVLQQKCLETCIRLTCDCYFQFLLLSNELSLPVAVVWMTWSSRQASGMPWGHHQPSSVHLQPWQAHQRHKLHPRKGTCLSQSFLSLCQGMHRLQRAGELPRLFPIARERLFTVDSEYLFEWCQFCLLFLYIVENWNQSVLYSFILAFRNTFFCTCKSQAKLGLSQLLKVDIHWTTLCVLLQNYSYFVITNLNAASSSTGLQGLPTCSQRVGHHEA